MITTRSFIVPICSPRISSIAARGKPKGSQVRKFGSFVPAGLNLPMGLFCAKSFWPMGVNEGASVLTLVGTPDPESGPAHEPLRSCTGAGPPVPSARSSPLYRQIECCAVPSCGMDFSWARREPENSSAVAAIIEPMTGVRIWKKPPGPAGNPYRVLSGRIWQPEFQGLQSSDWHFIHPSLTGLNQILDCACARESGEVAAPCA